MGTLQQRQLVLAVEGTSALGAAWSIVMTEYIEKIVRAFCEDSNGQKSPVELALVVFHTHGPYSGCLLQQCGWTSSMDVFFKWLGSISFLGGGYGDAAVAEALAEVLMMCCPGPSVPLQSQVWQKHCVLVAASNPHRLPTPVVRPPVTARMQTSATGEPQAEQWWLADAETVAKAFPLCQVSLSIIAPRQLPLLRHVYNGAKRNPRVLESVSDASKLYPHHLVLLSEGFMEGRMALRSAVVTSNVVTPPGVSAKLEQTIPTTSQAPAISGRSSSVNATIGGMAGRQPTTNTVDAASGQGLVPTAGSIPTILHNNVGNPSVQNSTISNLSGPEILQTSETSASNQDFKPGSLVANSVAALLNNTSTQPRHVPGPSTLGVANGPPAGMPGASVINTGVSTPLSVGQPTTLTTSSNQLAGVGLAASTVGRTGMGHNTLGVGAHNTAANSAGSSILVTGQPGAPGVNNLATGGLPGVGLSQVGTGVGQPQTNAIAGLGGLGSSSGGLGTPGVNLGVGTMMPTPGLPQPGQAVQSLGPSTAVVAGSANGMSTTATPPQQPNVKYTRLWEGILAGQRQQKPVPICKLEGYRQTSSSEKLAADWPTTMQIVRLIDQSFMQSKDYQGKAELLVFRPLSHHGFLVQLAEKKLCAVIQLPSQTLLLASTDKPGRMIGMLFPGDMVVFKPQLPSSGQQAPATGAVTGGASQVLGQAMGQSNFTQGQINNQQSHSQPAYKDQLSMSGPASLQGSGFLP